MTGATVDIKALEGKLDKGEQLTKEEEQFLLEKDNKPPEGYKGGKDSVVPVEDKSGTKEPASEENKPDKEKEALVGRAKAVNLPETATKEEIEAAEKKSQEAVEEKDPFFRLEKALEENKDKQDNQVNLPDTWTGREKAYFWQMRRDRKRAQQAEADRDAARFEVAKLKKHPKPNEEENKEKPVEEEDPLKGKDDTDFLTVADVRKLLNKQPKTKEPEDKTPGAFVQHPVVQNFLKLCDEQMAKDANDYEEVMELADEIIANNPDYQKTVADELIKGGNPARKMYELIKGDPEFAKLFPAAQTRVKVRKSKKTDKPGDKPTEEHKEKTAEELQKEKNAVAAQEALENNTKKPKTSGHASTEKIEGSEYTVEQIEAMSDREFAKLPKKIREKYLELYG